MRRKLSIGWVILAIFLGAIIGSVFGELVGLILPNGVVKEFFLRSASFGFSPISIDLAVVVFSVGVSLNLNVIGVIGIILAAYILRWYT